jgi:hypothetical protein
MTGAYPGPRGLRALNEKYADLAEELPPLGQALANGGAPYTQWEAWLALYHRKALIIALAGDNADREPDYKPTDQSRACQRAHLARLEEVERFPACTFTNADNLCNYIWASVLDLLLRAYAEEYSRAKERVAEGFIREMAVKVAGDAQLDFEGMQRAVRNAIEL